MNRQHKISLRAWLALVIGVVLVSVIATVAFAQDAPEPKKLTEKDAGTTVQLKPGDLVEISLAGNATTGYSWGVVGVDENVLKQVGDWTYKPDSDKVGAPGMYTLTFQAVDAGTTDLALGYKQWWNTEMQPEKTFEITAVVTAPAKPANKQLTKADNAKTIAVNTGDRIELALDCNPSTGYAWEITGINTAVLKQVNDVSFKASSKAIGAPGVCTFAFDALATGASALNLGYKQWWDDEMKQDPTFAATIVVNAPVPPTASKTETPQIGAPSVVNLTEKDSGSSVELATDGTLTIRLPGNATTGYTWGIVSNDANVLQPLGDWDYAPESNLAGAPGTFIFAFKGKNIGTSALQLGYKRWWDDNAKIENSFGVTVTVESPITTDMPLTLGAPIELSESDNKSRISAEKGQIINVNLDCNRTTGYSWRIMRNNGNVLEQIGIHRTKGGEIGAGGTCTHTFRVLRRGTSDLKLGYAQWFNDGAKPERTFVVHVDSNLYQ